MIDLKSFKGKKILILTHHNADIDAVCSSMALFYALGKLHIQSRMGIPKSISRQGKKLLSSQRLRADLNPDVTKYDTVFLLDTAVPEQIKPVKIKKAKELIIIDHHETSKLDADQKRIDTKKKSTCNLLLEILKENKIKVTKRMAKLMLAGIVADTKHLRLAELNTFKDIVYLMETGAKLSRVMSLVSVPPDYSEKVAKLKAITNTHVYKGGRWLIATCNVKSHEAAVARGLLKLGADVSIVAAKKRKEIRISGRANTAVLGKNNMNLARDVFSEVGELIGGSGGGHDAAGSANGPDVEKLDESVNRCLQLVSNKLGTKLTMITD